MKNKYLMIFMILSIIQNIANSLVHPVTPTLIKNLELGSYIFGVAYACMAFGQFILSPFWGKTIDIIGERKQMSIGVILYAIGQLIFMFATTESAIIIGRLIGGAGIGGVTVASLTYVVKESTVEERGKNLTYYTTITSVCATFGYLIGGVVGDYGITLPFYIQVITLFGLGILYPFLIRKRNDLSDTPIRTVIKDSNPFKTIIWKKGEFTKPLLILFMLAFVASLATTAYDQSFNYYLKDIFDFKPSYNGYIKAVVGIASLIANLTIAIKIQKSKYITDSLMVIFGISALSLFILSIASSLSVFLLANLVFFTVNSIYLPLVQNLCSDNGTKDNQGTIMGYSNSMKALGMIIGALIAGFIYTMDPKYPFYFAVIVFILALGLTWEYKKNK